MREDVIGLMRPTAEGFFDFEHDLCPKSLQLFGII
jgi:hypothetical protein